MGVVDRSTVTQERKTMKTRPALILGLIASSLLMTAPAPAQAEHGYPAGAFVIAKRDADDNARADERRRDSRRTTGAANDRGYGYGYERRQRDPEAGESAPEQRRRDRDQRSERRERSEDRGSRSERR